MKLFGLYSKPDECIVIYLKAKDKQHAIQRINETGGYQDKFFEEDCDYMINEYKKMEPDAMSTSFILYNDMKINNLFDIVNQLDTLL